MHFRPSIFSALLTAAISGCGGDDDGDGDATAATMASATSESSTDAGTTTGTTATTTGATSSSSSADDNSTAVESSSDDTAGDDTAGDDTAGDDAASSTTETRACGAELDLDAWPTSGFLIAFDAVGQHAHVWVDNPGAIDHVESWIAAPDGPIGIPGGPTEADGTFNPGYSYRLVPGEVSFADLWTEVCDAAPCYIEDDPQAWLGNPNTWCPWAFELVAIHDCRGADGEECPIAYP